MPAAVRLREDYSAETLSALARGYQIRRLLSLAAIGDGMDRSEAAKIGGMDHQTLRDWVHRFNASRPDKLLDNWTEGPKPRMSRNRCPVSSPVSRYMVGLPGCTVAHQRWASQTSSTAQRFSALTTRRPSATPASRSSGRLMTRAKAPPAAAAIPE
jgi:Winged helix-turn helix